MKRAIDVAVSLLGLAVAGLPMAVIALAILATTGRPILFTQARPGLHGKTFTIYKFRTMSSDRDKDGNLLPDERRVTPIGHALRVISLDELPELWNVLRGDMSLVGPRPLLPQYLSLYTTEQARRHELRPGITGLAQVEGRNALPWDRKLELDVWYVDHCSLALDVGLLARTAWAVLTCRGISQKGRVGADPFRGSC